MSQRARDCRDLLRTGLSTVRACSSMQPRRRRTPRRPIARSMQIPSFPINRLLSQKTTRAILAVYFGWKPLRIP